MDGIILIDKPKGWTSFDVVAKIRGLIRKETGTKKPRVGHTGTLDPLATGLLVIVVGKYTKRVPELSKVDKTYQVMIKLGEVSSTGDEEGDKVPVSENKPSLKEVNQTIDDYIGVIEQVPPIYSAIKVNGQRAYKLARQGKEVKLESRKVTIHEIADVVYEYPYIKFTVTVSSGTYIRSLVEDLGKSLGTGAYMTDLRRTRVGEFNVTDSHSIDSLQIDGLHLLE